MMDSMFSVLSRWALCFVEHSSSIVSATRGWRLTWRKRDKKMNMVFFYSIAYKEEFLQGECMPNPQHWHLSKQKVCFWIIELSVQGSLFARRAHINCFSSISFNVNHHWTQRPFLDSLTEPSVFITPPNPLPPILLCSGLNGGVKYLWCGMKHYYLIIMCHGK